MRTKEERILKAIDRGVPFNSLSLLSNIEKREKNRIRSISFNPTFYSLPYNRKVREKRERFYIERDILRNEFTFKFIGDRRPGNKYFPLFY